MNALRSIKEYFDMADDDDHKPAERYAGVHISEKLVPFPQLYVEETVAEPVPDVPGHYLRIDK